MGLIRVTINDRMMSGTGGETILSVARRHGITIPTLCSLPGLEPMGGCRICIVDIEGQPRPLPACITPIQDGMVIRTDTDRLQESRRIIVELLLAERNHTCPICIMNNACQLQDLARELGIDHIRFLPLAPAASVDLSHSRFGIDQNRCILCRRCVRVCDAIEGAHTWDVTGRGTASRIISDLDQPWGDSSTCTGCGKCVQACPTGALFEKGPERTEKNPGCLERIMSWRERRRG